MPFAGLRCVPKSGAETGQLLGLFAAANNRRRALAPQWSRGCLPRRAAGSGPDPAILNQPKVQMQD
jgi:hypothetical protein